DPGAPGRVSVWSKGQVWVLGRAPPCVDQEDAPAEWQRLLPEREGGSPNGDHR
ncbi:MAG: hypothetical protein UR93_C0007G0022, partial [Berkelbacteria bacterium GW2011_GWA2_35_9]